MQSDDASEKVCDCKIRVSDPISRHWNAVKFDLSELSPITSCQKKLNISGVPKFPNIP